MLDFFTGFVAPKFKRYDEAFANGGAPEGGGMLTLSDVVDNVTIPYPRADYTLIHPLTIMNTGFGRQRYERTFTGSQDRVVASFWLKFSEDQLAPNGQMGDSDFFCMRAGTVNTAKRIMALAVRKNPGNTKQGRVELWWSDGTYYQQFNFTGTQVAVSAWDTFLLDTWYWCEVLYDMGQVEFWVNGTRIISGSVPYAPVWRAGINWESYGFRTVQAADLVIQIGTDAALLNGERRVTTLFANADKIKEWTATTTNSIQGDPASSGYHWLQIAERWGYPQWWNQYMDTGSYLIPAAGQELFGLMRAYPIGPIEAICLTAFVNPNSPTTTSSFRFIMRKEDTGVIHEFAPVTSPVYSIVETVGWQRINWVSQIHLLDPETGAAWNEGDWLGSWQAGFKAASGPATITHFAVEILHSISQAGAGARYRVL